MRTKKVLLTVEPTKKAMNRAFSELAKPSKKYKDLEIISFPDFIQAGGEAGAKQQGKLRLEQKDYVMQDTDLVNFRFSK